MDYSANNEKGNGIVLEFRPFIRVYRDGRIERLFGTDTVPAGLDPQTGVESKDVNIDAHVSLSARLYLPKLRNPDGDKKFPILIFFHGGGFCIETASSPTYHNYINLVASEASVVVVSVDYRKAPEYPLPVAYDDSWAAVKWVESHARGHRPVERWLNDHVDYRRVFFTGDSAGGNIAHHMAIRAGIQGLIGMNLAGLVLMYPFFVGKNPIGNEADNPRDAQIKRFIDEIRRFLCPSSGSGLDDPMINPPFDTNLKLMACGKVLIFVAEKDPLRHRGFYYKEVLDKCGWRGAAEVVEANGERLLRQCCRHDEEIGSFH